MKAVAEDTKATFIQCDQTSLESVSLTVDEFLSKSPDRLDVLICNAGIMCAPPDVSKDGYEIHFGVNFLSHALFTRRLLPVLQRTAAEHGEARIVNLSSTAYEYHKGPIALADMKSTLPNMRFPAGVLRYCQTKYAQVLYTAELAKRYPSITSVAVHPGRIHTDMVSNLPLVSKIMVLWETWGEKLTEEEGCWNSCWAATAPVGSEIKSGGLYWPVGVPREFIEPAKDEKVWKELWEWTDEQLARWI